MRTGINCIFEEEEAENTMAMGVKHAAVCILEDTLPFQESCFEI